MPHPIDTGFCTKETLRKLNAQSGDRMLFITGAAFLGATALGGLVALYEAGREYGRREKNE